MRASGWLLPAGALLLWLAAVGYPGAAAAGALLLPEAGTTAADGLAFRNPCTLLLETTAYALAVALGAVMCGWAPGRLLGRALRGKGFVPVAALLLLPICLPAYVVFYTWWQSWPADSALHAWAIGHGWVPLLKRATLVLGLVCWSWPLVAWCVAGSAASVPAEHEEMLRLEGAGPLRRMLDRLRTDRRGLAIGAMLAFLAAFNNTTCYDLADIFTFGNELRAKDAMGAGSRQVLIASLPAVAIGALGAVMIWLLLSGRPRRLPRRTARSAPLTRALAGAVWLLSVLLPLALLLRNLGTWDDVARFMDFYGPSLRGTVELAGISGLLGMLIAVGLATAWGDHRRWVRVAAHVQAVGWLLAALVPGTIVAVALEAAYNIPLTILPAAAPLGGEAGLTLADVTYRSSAILVLGHVARFAFIAALLGRWVAVREPQALADMRRIDGAGTLAGAISAGLPRFAAAAVASFAIVLAFSMGELPVTARVHPPGSDPLAVSLLNAMHYQRPQTVMIAALTLMAAAVLAALVTAGEMQLRRVIRAGVGAIVVLAAGAMIGCSGDHSRGNEPLNSPLIFGSTGVSPGQYHYPRAIAIDRRGACVYVIDKTARVQRIGLDGAPELFWRMPESAAGMPTGLSVAPDGRVFVADTHYYRVIAYDARGDELLRFGSYGQGPGQFVYPTDIAFGPQGRLYVSEYGGNDRVQVFSPEGEYLFGFGSFGEAPGQFKRPQSLVFNRDATELYIADACNHRIVVTDPQGQFLRAFGGAGVEPGRLKYPYGLARLDDGTLLVSEFGNNRIQRFTPEGASLGRFGRLGTEPGELRYPWGVDATAGAVYVLDSGNNRVQVMDRP